jgi:hypothetical protein
MRYKILSVDPRNMSSDRSKAPAARTHVIVNVDESAGDPLEAYPTEAQVAAVAARRARRRSVWILSLVLIAGSAIIGVAAWPFVPGIGDRLRRATGLGGRSVAATLVIETTPPGWEVVEGARILGATPLRASLPAGSHSLVLRKAGANRSLDVVLPAGVEVFHHLDLQGVSATGILNVATTPPGAAVEVDGVGRGLSPIDVAGLSPGEHSVSATDGTRAATEQVTVAAGRTTVVHLPLAPPDTAAGSVGFVTLSAPIELQVYEGDSLVGSSRNQRIMLLAGRRTLRLANPALGFESAVAVTVEAGSIAKLTVPVPNGSLSVNASPWAEVTLDGKVIGETPIANRAVTPGTHEIVLRNPKFPEYRRTVVVSLAAPTRVGVDLRQ